MTTKHVELIFLDIPQYNYLINEPVVPSNIIITRGGPCQHGLMLCVDVGSSIGSYTPKWK